MSLPAPRSLQVGITPEFTDADSSERNDEREGFLEIIMDQNNFTESSLQSMRVIGEINSSLGDQLRTRTEMFAEASAAGHMVKAKAIIDLLAEDLSTYAQGIAKESAVFTSTFRDSYVL